MCELLIILNEAIGFLGQRNTFYIRLNSTLIYLTSADRCNPVLLPSAPDCSLCHYGASSVYYPDPQDCSKYWRCERIVLDQQGNYDYRRYHLQCGPSTYWNQDVLTCDWTPNTPECDLVVNTESTTASTTTTEGPGDDCGW